MVVCQYAHARSAQLGAGDITLFTHTHTTHAHNSTNDGDQGDSVNKGITFWPLVSTVHPHTFTRVLPIPTLVHTYTYTHARAITQVAMFGPWDALAAGVRLVDAPGLADDNSARNEVCVRARCVCARMRVCACALFMYADFHGNGKQGSAIAGNCLSTGNCRQSAPSNACSGSNLLGHGPGFVPPTPTPLKTT